MLNATDFDRSVLLDDLSGELNVEFKLSVSGVNLVVTTSFRCGRQQRFEPGVSMAEVARDPKQTDLFCVLTYRDCVI
jgi:hypothetical protein